MFKHQNRGIAMLGVLGIIAVLFVGVGAGILGYKYLSLQKGNHQQQNQNQQQTPNNQTNNNQPPIPSVSSTNQTANWKTYTNTQYGFKIQYPNNMRVQNFTNGVSLISSDNQRKIDIRVESVEPGQKDCRKTSWSGDTPNKVIDNTVFLGVRSGLKDEPYYGVMYCTIRNGLNYMITSHLFHVSGGPNNYPEDDPVLNQIISTFKFTK